MNSDQGKHGNGLIGSSAGALREFVIVTIVFGGAVAFPGCSGESGPPTYLVTGKVTFNGEPVEEGRIVVENLRAGYANTSDLTVGGAYSMELPDGSYAVWVEPPTELHEYPNTEPAWVEKNVGNIPPKYRTGDRSGFTIQIAGAEVTKDFDMKKP